MFNRSTVWATFEGMVVVALTIAGGSSGEFGEPTRVLPVATTDSDDTWT